MSSPTNLQVEWARLIAGTLASSGVADVVVSPGSRSTPLVWAVTRTPGLRITDVIDERVAGFFALGLVRGGGRPVALLCTSGSALAHYFPAVIEASESGLPLVALSADRPPEVQDAAANQTIRQPGLFGGFARTSIDLGVPEAAPAVLRGARRRVEQAVRAACGDVPGPVHLNVPFRKPLEPPAAAGDAERALADDVERVLRTAASPAPLRVRAADDAVVDEWADAIRAAGGRGLIACGPGAARDPAARQAVVELARASGFALLAEAASGLRGTAGAVLRSTAETGLGRAAEADADAGAVVVGHVDPLLRAGAGRTALRPALVIQIGKPLVATGWEALAALPDVRRVVTAWGWPDPHGTATTVVEADPRGFAQALAARLGERPGAHASRGAARPPAPPRDYAAAWRAADEAVERAAIELLARESSLAEGAAVRRLFAALPAGALVLAGNSLPVRHLDTWLPSHLGDVTVVCQRGASGIDGLLAGGAGLHRASGRPTAVLIGDVGFAHDLGGLAVLAREGPPCVVLVLDNGGGRIFEQLPVAVRAPEILPHLVTPPAVEIGGVVRAFGLRHQRVATLAELDDALAAALAAGGTTVVEATVPPSGAIALARALWDAARDVLAEAGA